MTLEIAGSYTNDGYNQGGSNVHIVIEKWLENVKNKLDILN